MILLYNTILKKKNCFNLLKVNNNTVKAYLNKNKCILNLLQNIRAKPFSKTDGSTLLRNIIR